MSHAADIEALARAVLYEGYLLYPYRPALKNRQRWTFGCVVPDVWRRMHDSGDRAHVRCEVLLQGRPDARLSVCARFMHVETRRADAHEWQEGCERELRVCDLPLGALERRPHSRRFAFPAAQWVERPAGSPGPAGPARAPVACARAAVCGTLELTAERLDEALVRVSVRINNETPMRHPLEQTREQALLCALAAAQVLLSAADARFVSLRDPPEALRPAAQACRNEGLWPALVGAPQQATAMLAAPIILDDYARLAPQSPGDFFDSTEIDELLALRILTLTDAEQRAIARTDARGAALLARTQALAAAQLGALHGAMRPRPLEPEPPA